ncbi:MAG: DegV family protein [Clostridia bacterium]
MKDFILATDSNTEFSAEYAKELGVSQIEMEIILDGKAMFASEIEDYNKFYEDMKNGILPTTTQINVDRFCEWFSSLMADGKDLLYFGLSSGLSGSFQSATIAKTILEEKFPKQKVFIVDSVSASMGEGLFLYTVNEYKKAGHTIEETADFAQKQALCISHWFTVDDLNHLYRGGRVSKLAAVFGTMLNIKPVLNVDDAGKLIPRDKVRGRRQALDALVEKYNKYADKSREQVVFASHGGCYEDAKYVLDKVLANNDVKFSMINTIGPVIGAHSGPGTVALFFYSKSRDI